MKLPAGINTISSPLGVVIDLDTSAPGKTETGAVLPRLVFFRFCGVTLRHRELTTIAQRNFSRFRMFARLILFSTTRDLPSARMGRRSWRATLSCWKVLIVFKNILSNKIRNKHSLLNKKTRFVLTIPPDPFPPAGLSQRKVFPTTDDFRINV